MKAEKGDERVFALSVIVAILCGRQLFPNDPINLGEVAEVNEFLFPLSGSCLGLLVASISQKKTRKEILKQIPEFTGIDLKNLPVATLYAQYNSDRVKLISTGR